MSSLDTSHSDNNTNSNTSYLDAYKTLLKHRHWIVAFSGGLDSTMLLHSVSEFLQSLHLSQLTSDQLTNDQLKDQASSTSTDDFTIPSLSAIHINHQLQSVSADWEKHCQSVCEQLSVPLTIKKVAVANEGKGLESAARQARYIAFEEQLAAYSASRPQDNSNISYSAEADSVLLMGHHANDQAETLLMRLFRGAGTRGAAAMPMQRSLGKSQIARPLLHCTRANLAAYAVLNELPYIEDPSNTDESFDRNFVRQQVLPKLEARWPSVVTLLNRYSEHASGDSELLADLARLDLQTVDASEASVVGSKAYGVSLSITACLDLSLKRRSNLLRYWLSAQQLNMPSTAQMAQIDNLLLSASSGAIVQLGAYRLCPYRDRLYLLREDTLFQLSQALDKNMAWTFGESMTINGLGTLLVSEEPQLRDDGEVTSEVASEVASEDSVGLREGVYTLGRKRDGLHFRYRGMSRSVKKCFNEHGIPPWLRDHYPLLYAGDELAAIPGILVCDNHSMVGACALDWQWD